MKKGLRKRSIGPKELFERTADKCNFIQPDLAQDVVFAMIRVIVEELRTGNRVVIPRLGKFYVQKKRNQMVPNRKTGQVKRIGDVFTVRFRADNDLSAYFDSINKN